tara:strand:- start:32850 stop:33020 length:171 start_codon:yes stop_codon:yes gene_type:complete
MVQIQKQNLEIDENQSIKQEIDKEVDEFLEKSYFERYDDLDTQEAMINANVLGINY